MNVFGSPDEMSRPSPFALTADTLSPTRYAEGLRDRRAGGYASFEGWVRIENQGRTVVRLEYEAYSELAVSEGARVVREAAQRFALVGAACVHRVGALEVGDLAVWVGACAQHREQAFAGCRYIIDHVKAQVPIWKHEFYEDGSSEWARCGACASFAHLPASDARASVGSRVRVPGDVV